MPLTRRAALGAAMLPFTAHAQDAYPSRPVTLVTGYAPGGLTDLTTRSIAERMQRELGQPVVVENRVGAATAIASTAVAGARPDATSC
jgi:tripartite-type tricarboxylate transporter receptor subunit TctC